ncbi:MAG: ATP-binding cassette domain-containing protein [Rickettsiales bacterium]|jgi:ATP-binding cassette subfamily B protein|nr:ATP-binding cassette domain-containing protein [Rickettsiales bacterium]
MSRSNPHSSDRAKGKIADLLPILSYLLPYKWQVMGASIAVLFTSSAVLGLGWGLKYLVDEGLSKGNSGLLDRAFLLLIGVTLLLAVASYIRFYLVSWIGERVVADIRRDVYRTLLAMPIGFFEKTRTGELLSRLTTDTTLLQTVIGSSVSVAARNIITMTGAIILLLFTSAKLTGYMFLMLPLVVAPIIIMGKRVRFYGRESQERIAEISAHAEESLYGIRTVQAFSLEPHEGKRFERHLQSALKMASLRIRTRALLTALVIMLIFGAIVTVLWFGGKDVLAGRISAGDLSAFVFYSVIVAGAVGAISEVITDLQRAAGAADRLRELLLAGGATALTQTGSDSAFVMPTGGIVVFDDVTFTYPARPEKPALEHFSLAVKSGQMIALVGPSGAGKTTLFNLLLRFYEPDSGAIRINGQDIHELTLEELRGMIGIVPQDATIFSGSARSNILMGKMDATEEELMQAVRSASALEFLEKLPEGLDTHLGEKGVQLSGGQRQRIAIARAILRNPRILLLDEATSALDSENEHHIQQALEQVMWGRTTFVIAHRLSTITRADQIVLLDEGRIAAIGTHAELLNRSPLYARLAELQFRQAA